MNNISLLLQMPNHQASYLLNIVEMFEINSSCCQTLRLTLPRCIKSSPITYLLSQCYWRHRFTMLLRVFLLLLLSLWGHLHSIAIFLKKTLSVPFVLIFTLKEVLTTGKQKQAPSRHMQAAFAGKTHLDSEPHCQHADVCPLTTSISCNLGILLISGYLETNQGNLVHRCWAKRWLQADTGIQITDSVASHLQFVQVETGQTHKSAWVQFPFSGKKGSSGFQH